MPIWTVLPEIAKAIIDIIKMQSLLALENASVKELAFFAQLHANLVE